MQVHKLGGTPPKNPGAKIMRNFGRFWITSDFDREYLWNGWRYPKSADLTNYGNSSCVWWKKFGELWSTNGLEFHVSLDQLKCTFWQTIFQPIGGAAPWKCYTRYRLTKPWQRTPEVGRGPPKKCNRENLKFGLKFSVLATIASGLVGVSPQNIFHTTCLEAGVITLV